MREIRGDRMRKDTCSYTYSVSIARLSRWTMLIGLRHARSVLSHMSVVF